MMKLHTILCACMMLSLMPPALAATSATGDETLDEKDIVRSVELDGLVFPITENRQLLNYMFVSARMRVAPGLDAWTYRAKAHLIRDAIILAAHRETLHVPGNIELLDLERVETVCLKAANEAIGEDGALVEVIFTRVASKMGFMQ